MCIDGVFFEVFFIMCSSHEFSEQIFCVCVQKKALGRYFAGGFIIRGVYYVEGFLPPATYSPIWSMQ